MTYEPVASALQTYKKDNFIIGTMGNEGDVKQNALIFLKEDPYAVRDDGGYLIRMPSVMTAVICIPSRVTSCCSIPRTGCWRNPSRKTGTGQAGKRSPRRSAITIPIR